MNKKLTKQLYNLVVQAAAWNFFVTPRQYSTLVTICCTQRDYVTVCQVSDFLVTQQIVLDDTALVLMLKHHATHNNLDRALKSFSHQQTYNVINSVVYNVMLTICIQFRAFEEAETIYEQMKLAKVQLTVTLATTLISMYINNNQLEKAMDLYSTMHTSELTPDAVTYTVIIAACTTMRAFEAADRVWYDAQQAGILSTELVSSVMKMYCQSDRLDSALELYGRIRDTQLSAVTYTVMIAGCIASREFATADRLWRDAQLLQNLSIELVNTALTMYCKRDMLDEALALYSRTQKKDAITYTILITSCVTAQKFATADQLWRDAQTLRHITTELFNVAITMYCQSKQLSEAITLYNRMKRETTPNAFTYTILITACTANRDFSTADQIWFDAQKLCKLSTELVTCVLKMYCRSSRLSQALELYRKMLEIGLEPNDVTFIVLLSGCNSYNDYKAGMQIIELLQSANITMTPNLLHTLITFYMDSDNNTKAYELFDKYSRTIPFTLDVFKTLVSDCSSGAFVDTMESKIVTGEFLHPLNNSILILCYAYRGEYDKSVQVFEQAQKDSSTYEALLYTYAIQGNGQQAVQTLREMLALGEKPTEKSYTSVLSACSHRYMIAEAKQIVAELQNNNQYTEILQVCMVDVLSRAGELEEAISVAHEIKGNAFIAWKAILAGCKQYNDVQRSLYVSQQLQKYAPNDTSTHVLMANIYATAGMKKERDAIRRMIDERGLKKIPGVSYVKLGKEYHKFYVEDKNASKEVVEYLDQLRTSIKKYNYVPDTSCVLRDFATEEERVIHLWRHSEKLALATALLHHSDEVFITKNLRICLDCHTAIKLISKHTERTIKIKDASRLHTMTDGVCDCGDQY